MSTDFERLAVRYSADFGAGKAMTQAEEVIELALYACLEARDRLAEVVSSVDAAAYKQASRDYDTHFLALELAIELAGGDKDSAIELIIAAESR